MKHELYKEQLNLYILDELEVKEKAGLLRHLNNCDECRNELETLKKLKVIMLPGNDDIPERLLSEARQELRARIRIERNRKTAVSVISGWVNGIKIFQPAYILSGLVFLAAGLIIGYLLFNNPPQNNVNKNIQASGEAGSLKITNVKFIDSDASDGVVEFMYEEVKPVRVKGNINDEEIRSVLTFAMLSETNPGVRLNTLNFINESSPDRIDPEVKAAVITVVKYDENPGVRREAFSLLKNLPYDSDIKETYLYVLMNDSVSGLRIEAINGLFTAARKGELFTKEELSVFKERMQEDDNTYIRLRAKNVLKEYN